jgi:hypothetical protein
MNYKLFAEPPLQCSPTWDEDSDIVTPDVVALLNPMISPNRRDVISFKLFSSTQYGFDFDRMGRRQ